MPFLLAEILNFQGSTHRIGVGSFSEEYVSECPESVRSGSVRFRAAFGAFSEHFLKFFAAETQPEPFFYGIYSEGTKQQEKEAGCGGSKYCCPVLGTG